MKNKSTLLKIRKNEKFLYIGNTWRKQIHAKPFYKKKKIEKSLKEFSERSDRKVALVVKGIFKMSLKVVSTNPISRRH